jgi:uncharacterized protein YodC (DUF2158 family)
MKVGDIVRVKHNNPKYRDIGIVLNIDTEYINIQCLWYDGNTSWCGKHRLEVISESR